MTGTCTEGGGEMERLSWSGSRQGLWAKEEVLTEVHLVAEGHH